MRTINLLLTLFAGLFFVHSFVLADDASSITQRMQERLSQIDQLKLTEKVGENNQGFLEARNSLSGRESALIGGENSDRKSLYAIVAQKTGQSVKEVGVQRALRIAQQSKGGLWLQDASGNWYKKP